MIEKDKSMEGIVRKEIEEHMEKWRYDNLKIALSACFNNFNFNSVSKAF